MDGVIYREYQPNDFDMLSEIIKITWNHGKYYSYGVSCRVADAYLRFCLSEQTFAQVAEVNEKTVGIIIGNNFLKRHFHFNYFLYAMYDIICLSMSKEGRNAWRFFRNIDKIYKELLSLQIKNMMVNCLFLWSIHYIVILVLEMNCIIGFIIILK